MLTALLWLSPFIAIAFLVWYYRRKAAAREAASNERLKAFFDKTAGTGATGAEPSAPPATPSAPMRAPVVEAGMVVPPTMRFAVRERLLSQPQALLYYLLKTGLPEYEVLAQVGAATVVDMPLRGFEGEAHQRRLAGAVVDFVVCDKSFKAVAAVRCGGFPASAAEPLAYARACCEAAGLRWVEIAPDALPRRETVRAVVLGA